MSIITISRGSYSYGKEVAEKLAQRLGYACISREVILEASEHFNIPEILLNHAIHDAPSILDHFTYGKERYIAYVREAILHHFVNDNIVYHGLAGHFFVQRIPHVLKVRILADLEDRVAEEMKRDGVSAAKARNILLRDDKERHRWSNHLYGIDTRDPHLYDLMIHLRPLSVDQAVNVIQYTVTQPCFQTTPESQKMMELMFRASQVQAQLVNEIPSAKVDVEAEEIVVHLGDVWGGDEKMVAKVDQIIDKMGATKVKIRLVHQ